jgi:putative ABC transport system permease protein
MLLAALRDLQWRRKRFIITIAGTALVFAMSLLMSGLSNSFTVEIDRTLDDQRAQRWISRDDVAGAFSPGSFLTLADVTKISETVGSGVVWAPLLYGAAAITTESGTVLNVNVMGVESGKLGAPQRVTAGSPDLDPGTAIVPEILGSKIGESINISGTSFQVSGIVEKASLVAGTPTVTLNIAEAQKVILGGQPLISMVLAQPDPTSSLDELPVPDGFQAFTRAEVTADLLRPLENPVASIDFVKILLWMVAALIIASVVYLTVLERTRDIAVFKATGSSTWSIGMGICLQAVILAVLASIIGIGLAVVLAPMFPMEVAVSSGAMVMLPFLAIVVGVLAGLIGVRRTVRVEPATAFGGP